jgi:hypothetical protein
MKIEYVIYRYSWGNNPHLWKQRKRATLKNRLCRILATGKKNSVMVEFEDGQREIVSRRALRKVEAENK